MAVRFQGWKKLPWVVFYKNPWSGAKRTKGFATESEAYIFDAAQKDMVQKEKKILAQTRKMRRKTQRMTVKELMNAFFLESPMAEVTRKQARYHAAHIIAIFGNRDTGCLDTRDILAFSSFLRERGLAQSTIARRIGILRRAINWAVTNGIIAANPLSGLRLPRCRSLRIAPPTPKEIRSILAVAAPHVSRVTLIGFLAGPRIGPSELFRLEWRDVDFTSAVIRMPCAAKGRGAESRDVPMGATLQNFMQKWKKEDGSLPWVIHWKGKPVRTICHAWHAALKRAGIERRIRPYDLRHAFATYALSGGADIGSVASLMGHSDPSMILKVYQHVQDTQKRAAVETVSNMLSLKKYDIPQQEKEKN